MNEQIILGTCDGTGAAINVCLGFVPRYVKVFNLEDAGNLFPSVEWWNKQMLAISAFDEGVKEVTGTTYIARSALGSAGISPYTGGDEIQYDGASSHRWEDSAGTDKEEVYVNGRYIKDANHTAAYECIGDTLLGRTPIDGAAGDHGAKFKTPPGFTIGTDSDLNADGEQLIWLAIQ